MKVRSGFVSNSSSSSFVCDVSGESFSGYDGEYDGVAECECSNGHTFGDDFLLPFVPGSPPAINVDAMRKRLVEDADNDPGREGYKNANDEKITEWYEKSYSHEWLESDTDTFETPPDRCPICTFEHAFTPDLLGYFLKKGNLKKKDVLALIKKEFGSYVSFQEFLK